MESFWDSTFLGRYFPAIKPENSYHYGEAQPQWIGHEEYHIVSKRAQNPRPDPDYGMVQDGWDIC